ncbi:TonB-dependent receptor [Aestuariicella hydrocarbonica]|uniref:TonB-dependent receptor n=1 Tax=Pseudomaricurvus hydrocarbonicus TaxID=1470433 RepID=A0A9E5JUY7_9GAMM|nr:TonB-dependent receptor [Aestuariicella hydrocarbonica]NHO66058.1 TonB-dependent receptor [Aestuariicella hydrocarbonica]
MMYQRHALPLAIVLASCGSLTHADGAIEEVIVTAQKREQSLQDTPIAISAFDSSSLEQRGIQDVSDVGQFAPNVQIAKTPGNSTGATIGIRGSVTFNPAITWEPTVGMYMDGVFLGKNLGGIFDIADLERIEVLRGPQGTLYGKNTIGGAVNLITRKPSGEFSGNVKATMGNEDYYSLSTSIDTPSVELLGGSLNTNLALLQETRDGFTRNVADPLNNPMAGPSSSDDFGNIDNQVGRFSALWSSDRAEVQYTYDYSNNDTNPPAAQLTDVPAGAALDIGGGILLPVDGVLSPYVTSDSKRSAAISSDQSRYEKAKTQGHALHLSWDMGELGFLGDTAFKSITAYRTMDWGDWIDIDGSPLDFFHSSRDVSYDQVSQEFQLLGQTERTHYVLGLYYFQEQGDIENLISFMSIYGFPASHNEYGMDNTSLAAFGQIDWLPSWAALEDRLTLTFGLRWTKEEKDQYISHPDSAVVIPYTEADDTWTNVSPSLVASWALTDAINVYGKVSQGWKSGGFNGEATSQDTFLASYDPETVTAYELGLKSRWLDNRLQVNAAVFQNHLEDMQFSVFLSGSAGASTVDNAGQAEVTGAEIEIIAQPLDNLQLNLSYGYLDPEYKEFLEIDPASGQMADFKNQRDFPYAGRNTASLGIDYTVGSYDWGTILAHVDWSYQDDFVPYVDPALNTAGQIKSYDLINARLSLTDIDVGNGQAIQVALWGKNLTDQDYRQNTIPFGLWTTSYFGDPRTYGLDVRYDF